MNQTQFAAIGGVGKTTQINYESGNRLPDAGYLASLSKVGLDVQYVITGVRSSAALSPDEQELVARYRAASLELKAAAVGALAAGTRSSADAARKSQVFHGSVGQSISVEGDLDQRGTRFTVKGSKKK
ncbi:helix-turn-helix domain-containing protein [Burkholderia sp. BCC0397]|uniref:helix-turn-helix domain-containing protein n=1 Tax=Burkholderia sp. BCC0397 TaxID=486876 RepID=UPI001FC8D86F|nr:helix-turn-helix domain-containing protein [Burkholderia sp. BCC0397]